MLRALLLIIACGGMAACVVAPILYFFGRIDVKTYQDAFLAGSLIWFVFAAWWGTRRKDRAASS